MSSFLKKTCGFTLIELMITVAIVGILATIAYPSYTEFIARSNRSEGQRELLKVANLMEQYFLDHRQYTTDLTKLGYSGASFLTESKKYRIKAITGTTSKFKLRAIALNAQATNDSACVKLFIDNTGKKISKPSASGCWEK